MNFSLMIILIILLIIHVYYCSFANRLTNIKENHKFQEDGKEGHRVEDPAKGLRHIVSYIKEQHAVKYDF